MDAYGGVTERVIAGMSIPLDVLHAVNVDCHYPLGGDSQHRGRCDLGMHC